MLMINSFIRLCFELFKFSYETTGEKKLINPILKFCLKPGNKKIVEKIITNMVIKYPNMVLKIAKSYKNYGLSHQIVNVIGQEIISNTEISNVVNFIPSTIFIEHAFPIQKTIKEFFIYYDLFVNLEPNPYKKNQRRNKINKFSLKLSSIIHKCFAFHPNSLFHHKPSIYKKYSRLEKNFGFRASNFQFSFYRTLAHLVKLTRNKAIKKST